MSQIYAFTGGLLVASLVRGRLGRTVVLACGLPVGCPGVLSLAHRHARASHFSSLASRCRLHAVAHGHEGVFAARTGVRWPGEACPQAGVMVVKARKPVEDVDAELAGPLTARPLMTDE